MKTLTRVRPYYVLASLLLLAGSSGVALGQGSWKCNSKNGLSAPYIKPALLSIPTYYTNKNITTQNLWYINICGQGSDPCQPSCGGTGYLQQFEDDKCLLNAAYQTFIGDATVSESAISWQISRGTEFDTDFLPFTISIKCDPYRGNLNVSHGVGEEKVQMTDGRFGSANMYLVSDTLCEGFVANSSTIASSYLPSCSLPSGKSSSGCGGGCVFLILLIIVPLVYFTVFVSINALQGKRGKDLLPHREFWVSVPGLVVDGFRSCKEKIFRRGSSSNTDGGTYSEINNDNSTANPIQQDHNTEAHP